MIKNFSSLGIKEEILEIIEKEGFKQPTSIQNKTIPYIFAGRDIIATAATGSGKTLAYTVRLIQNSTMNMGLQGLVIVPTRDLAKQVGEVLKKFAKNKSLNIMISYGGGSLKEQKKTFEDIDILVATPGRIKQFIEEDILYFSNLRTVVLDEVDSVFQGDFIEDIDYILRSMPRKKQTLVFSATISKEIYLKIKHWMKDPKRINVEKYVSSKKLKQTFYEVNSDKKLSLLSHLLEHERSGLNIIFVNRQDTAEFLSKNLKDTGLDIRVVHGDMPQGKRNKIIKDFEEEKFDVLITTDMAARGLDINNITHIYNYNIPKHSEKYVHRIGRTARAGNEGKVINLVSNNDLDAFAQIMKDHRFSMLKKDLPKFKEVVVKKQLVKKNKHIKN